MIYFQALLGHAYIDQDDVNQRRANPLNFFNYDQYASMDNVDTAKTLYITPTWQDNFLLQVLGHVEEIGFPQVRSLRKTLSSNLINQLTNPLYNPYLVGMYRTPAMARSTNTWFTNWADVRNAFDPASQNITSWPEISESDGSDGYAHVAKAAASFLPGTTVNTPENVPLTGDKAWAWINQNVKIQTGPKWSIVPR
jgi:hypothetical protein